MKRTTYIFIGIFFANVLIALGFGIYFKSVLVGEKRLVYRFDAVQQQGSIDLSDVHALEFFANGVDNNGFYFIEPGVVLITPSKEETGDVLSYPVSDYLKLEKKDGVLKVMLNLPEDPDSQKRLRNGNGVGISLEGLTFNIEAGKALNRVFGDKAFRVAFNRIRLDSLCLNTQSASVDSCVIRSLVLGGGMSFEGDNSRFDELHVDLDDVRSCKMGNSKVNTLYLTGSKKCQNVMSEGQYNRLVWEPKTEKAELNLRLKGKSEVISHQ